MKKLITICLLIVASLTVNAQSNLKTDPFFTALAEKPIGNKLTEQEIFVARNENKYQIVNNKSESTIIITKSLENEKVIIKSIYTNSNKKAYILEYLKENNKLYLQNLSYYFETGTLGLYGKNLYKGKGVYIQNRTFTDGDIFINQVINGVDGEIFVLSGFLLKDYYKIKALDLEEKDYYKKHFGIMNSIGDVVTPLIYQTINQKHGILIAQLKANKPGQFDMFGVINVNNKIILPFIYKNEFDIVAGERTIATSIQEEIFGPSYFELYDYDGVKLTNKRYSYIAVFSEGLARCKKIGGKYGFLNEKGIESIPFIYDNVTDFKNGKSKVNIGDREFYIDKTGKEF